jgi:hypothetical protein
MTRVYQRPLVGGAARPQARALIIGAGAYPHAKAGRPGIPNLFDLTSVVPSIMGFVSKLVRDWADTLLTPLGSVDLLLSDPASPAGATWPGLGVAGEIAPGSLIGKATLGELRTALTDSLQGAATEDLFLFLCCGHGFWRGGGGYFVLSDFGADENDPWANVISLRSFQLGLRQKAPRKQWFFSDCCSNFPDEVLRTLGEVGNPLIQPTTEGLTTAERQFGTLWQFGMSSSTVGQPAFGLPNSPSRFSEMLVEALDGAGAVSRVNGEWWVDHVGIEQAIKTYSQRKPDLSDPSFYNYPAPISSDGPGRMRFRRLSRAPTSCLIVSSQPRVALKDATIVITPDGGQQSVWEQRPPPPSTRAMIYVPLPAQRYFVVSATFGALAKSREIFAELPLAEPMEFIVP